MFSNQFTDSGHQFVRNFHNGLRLVLKGCLVLRHRIILRLLLIVCENPADALFIPPWRKLILFHLCYQPPSYRLVQSRLRPMSSSVIFA